MKIGIIVHSQTEHTYSVAQKLQDKLLDNGHETNLERVITIGDTYTWNVKTSNSKIFLM